MNRTILLLLSILIAAAAADANTFQVDTVKSAGPRSLRWAINRANTHAGADRITFNSGLIGGVIKPATALPPLTDSGTTISGDINRDGLPDITLNGSRLGSVDGLAIQGNDCLVRGLAIVRFQRYGLFLNGVTGCRVWGCHLGVNRRGDTSQTNGGQLVLLNASENTIGKAGRPNIVSAGTAGLTGQAGINLGNAQNNLIEHNYLGLTRAGNTSFGDGSIGINLSAGSGTATGNVIRHNRFGRLAYGVTLRDADRNSFLGNWFGLGTNGTTALPIASDGILLEEGSSENVIGGTTAAVRNVFVGGQYSQGIEMNGVGNDSNRIQGNYFGTTADGTRRRSLTRGVVVHAGSGAQLIGGAVAAGNYFVLRAPAGSSPTGIDLSGGGSGTTIRNNIFGRLPAGGDAPTDGTHVRIDSATGVRVLDNLVARATYGVLIQSGAGGPPAARFYRNTVRNCIYGVTLIGDVSALLGNLGNTSTADDGGNRFRSSNQWHIWNETPNRIRAEGNSFGTTVRAEIDAKIRDKLEDPAAGRVDFDPLQGGVHPSGSSEVVLALTGTAALATAGGAEIVYTLSAPAQVSVEVINIAGRPVASVLHDRASGAGLQRTLWNGRSSTGTVAPAGRYLVRITARSAPGGQASALAPLQLTAARR